MSEQTDSGIREMLVRLLDEAGVERGYVGGERFREHVADYILPHVTLLLAEAWDQGQAAGLHDRSRWTNPRVSPGALILTENPHRKTNDE